MKEIIESLSGAITSGARDWAGDRRLAWIYGIICGWDDESYSELQEEFKWDKDEINRNKRYHKHIQYIEQLEDKRSEVFREYVKCKRGGRFQKREYLAGMLEAFDIVLEIK